MGNVRRVYVEKKPEFAAAAKALRHEFTHGLSILGITGVRRLIRYDVEHISEEVFEKAKTAVFSEPPVDNLYEETFDAAGGIVFSVEFLPGQFDQRADSAVQCIQLLDDAETPLICTAVTYVISGDIKSHELEAVKRYCINPVDSREAGMEKPQTLVQDYIEPPAPAVFDGFADMDAPQLRALYESLDLAMSFPDFLHIQNYFKHEEKRGPSITEIRVLDAYWSDHCRHTTFFTELTEISFGEGYYKKPIMDVYADYLASFQNLYEGRKDKYVCLMDLALMAMLRLKKEGKLPDLEESGEHNACSIIVPVEINGKKEEWLINFKNETHNHPTEIEPFGGAATCLGGAVRDPLSARTYVYQAMRVTGAADPRLSADQTLKGKLPQKSLTRGAARGFSSYGNQIGIAAGCVKEVYHPDYAAKRMEIGAVIGAAPKAAVQRLPSEPGDAVVLLGGRTGRDGCGGAAGSSKAHNVQSIAACGAQVQKGNPPTERKLQRLFRRQEVSRLIKKCNDFGAGGAAVAVGELADGLYVELDKIPKKYAGLDGTELAISESQERMACVIAPQNLEAFLAYAKEENLEAAVVAAVTKEPRLVLVWRGEEIVNLSRAFLNTNGVRRQAEVKVDIPAKENDFFKRPCLPEAADALACGDLRRAWLDTLKDLNVCSQKGLVEMFDSSIGACSVWMPYGGRYQLTQTQAMAAKIPVMTAGTDADLDADIDTDTATVMAFGFDPYLSSWSPFHGAAYAVLESLAKIAASGGDYSRVRFTFQEYFGSPGSVPSRWGRPFAALLGAYAAQTGLGLPAIGGKDSMSGTFDEIDVPPTLVSFAVDTAKTGHLISPELKAAGNKLVKFSIETDAYGLPVYEQVKKLYGAVHRLIQDGIVKSAYALDAKGIAAAASKMAFGNKLGVTIDAQAVTPEELFAPGLGSLLAEMPQDQTVAAEAEIQKSGLAERAFRVIGEVNDSQSFVYGSISIGMEEALAAWTGTLEQIFPSVAAHPQEEIFTGNFAASPAGIYHAKNIYICRHKTAKPTVFIPVFPGTNCEDDSAGAFQRAGARVLIKIFRNQGSADIRESVMEFAAAVRQSQIVMFPGGFSAGDEPEGSAKFFANVFRNERIKEAAEQLLNERDGLMLGICNGFQALIKLGLLPHGKITDQKADSPALTYNTIGRHVSRMVYTKVVSDKSPWLSKAKLGGIYVNPASHGEGRFAASRQWLERLLANGQIAAQYVDEAGSPTMDGKWNVNGSYLAVEGITSPDGRIFGKMAHSERIGKGTAANIYGEQDMGLFEAGVEYFQ